MPKNVDDRLTKAKQQGLDTSLHNVYWIDVNFPEDVQGVENVFGQKALDELLADLKADSDVDQDTIKVENL